MASKSNIEWTEATWNPVTGCTKVSAGCANCYAEALTKRFEKDWGKFSEVKIHPYRLSIPKKKKNPTVYFVNSMSDLFHKDVPTDFILEIFNVMRETPQHTYQILTKRPERLYEMNEQLIWAPNIWMGVSVENKRVYPRIDFLRKADAMIKFLSVEPLLESVADINVTGLDWVIVGGESGLKARPLQKKWVVEVLRACRKEKVAFFFKQWGGKNKKLAGRILNGREYNEMPITPKIKKAI
ncbi:phage Gp37/Gp68 family protein [Leptospira weilii]|uniref:Phage protein Gp37/Gp68 n=1 Tax=Leptospira weilii str. UI 13098 TaxID=1088542 RepID=M6QF48_9LEPT|nr:phage Gp37/Gp68 family protein [Leptospira weilii]EMN46116.1 phage protein Gp37/Gp68 [Leptospira weilii str. LNT 1234]EMN91123.1 phage protein Gp37/Gp68 [Leptospira weilii str. UI 13098]OMI17760.1 hypothetical protein BUQ74_08125 [Leptospira weilii serovar Heyan]UPY79155.1 phage Gp37/Gp68 family protein [Leptospira weilii]